MRRVLGAAASTIFALPLVGLWRDPGLSWPAATLLTVVAAATLARPATGLLVVAGLFPMAPALNLLLGTPAIAEPLLLTFLVAALLQGAVSARRAPLQLAAPALVLGATLVGWAVVALSARQLWTGDAPGALLQTVARDTAWSYFSPQDEASVVRSVLPWLEAIALAVVAERIVRDAPGAGRRFVRMFVFAGAVLSASSAIRLAEISLRQEAPSVAALAVLRDVRLNAFYPDINAAGSIYALFAVAAVWLAVRRSRLWLAPAGLLLLAVWLAGSRAAFGGVVGGLGLTWFSASRPRIALVLGALVAAVAVLAVVAALGTRNASVFRAGGFRVEMTRAGLALAAERPLFGIGLDNFKAASLRHLPADFGQRFRWAARGENAHDNFLQILVELGLVGLLGFLWLIGTPFRSAASRGWIAPHAAPEATALAGGIAALLVSALLGHPLLDPHIRASFFLAVGLVTGMSVPAPAGSRTRPALAGLAIGAIAIALPARMDAQRAMEPIAGFSRGAPEAPAPLDGVTYRVADPRSTWFLASTTRTVTLPLRARQDGIADCRVSIAIDGRPAGQVVAGDAAWGATTLQLPPADRPRSWRRLDLTVEPARCTLLVGTLTQR